MTELSDQARRNREYWDRTSDWYQGHAGTFIERGLAWGVWQVPEAELRVLGDVAGKDVLELGCGAAEWSRALARVGARPVGLDNAEARLAHARAALEAEGLDFPLVHASAESVPLPDESFDVVMCDWGATSFADPYLVVPEVARLLRSRGLFAFCGATPLSWLCIDEEADTYVPRLCRPLFGMHRWDTDQGSVDFNLPTGKWIRLFVESGFVVEDLVEVRPPPGATSPYRDAEETEWGRSWPLEHIWKVRRR